jgi:uncharacterized membrane protein
MLLLAGLVALAFALRLYRLTEQSAWVDEFQLAGNLDAPHLGTYISLLRFRGRDGFPFYYILFYYWNAVVGHGGLPALRMLAMLCNIASIPLLYLLTKSVFGRTAAGIAALCATLSPLQIWYAQSIHVTAFWALLALASVAMLHRAACTGRLRWWFLPCFWWGWNARISCGNCAPGWGRRPCGSAFRPRRVFLSMRGCTGRCAKWPNPRRISPINCRR